MYRRVCRQELVRGPHAHLWRRSRKCFVRRFGGNICAKIQFQTDDCADCEAPTCLNCVCILGAGGGDKCNNGVNGFDYICVRGVRR